MLVRCAAAGQVEQPGHETVCMSPNRVGDVHISATPNMRLKHFSLGYLLDKMGEPRWGSGTGVAHQHLSIKRDPSSRALLASRLPQKPQRSLAGRER